MIDLFLQSAGIIFLYATLWFGISILKKRNDLADVAWGLGYILLCVFYFFTQEVSSRSILMGILVTLWGIRLSVHIYARNKNKKEDFRYAQWRKDWGKYFYLRSYFQIYILQGLFLLVIMVPIMIVNSYSQPGLNLLDTIGVALWLLGFYFETIGDLQLSRFLKNSDNKGKIMKTGLWKYTRHPNYFGEVTMWWGVFIVGLSSPMGWYGIISALFISFLILKVSGIPMLEKKYDGRPEYQSYKEKTNAFFPWWPKK